VPPKVVLFVAPVISVLMLKDSLTQGDQLGQKNTSCLVVLFLYCDLFHQKVGAPVAYIIMN
jgi:hypothetical protein